MECNRDEATRAKEIAEKKFAANDVSGAKKFALKAQTLYPDLKGLSQMLAMLDVLLSAEIKIDGEADWYGILGVEPSADDETIKKQYRKLALMIHSDKNKSAGADEAFRLISDARDFLSDNSKRIAYNQKRFPKTSQQHDHVPPAAAATATAASGMGNSSTPPVAQSSTYTPSPPAGLFSQPLGSTYTTSPSVWEFFQQLQNSNHHFTSQNSYASASNPDAALNWGSSTPWLSLSHQQQHQQQQIAPAAASTPWLSFSHQQQQQQQHQIPIAAASTPRWPFSHQLQQQQIPPAAASTSTGWGYKRHSKFSTNCSHCKMSYKPPLEHLNQWFRCSNCNKLFLAIFIHPA